MKHECDELHSLSDDALCNEIDDLLSVEAGMQAQLAALRRKRDALKKERIRRGVDTRSVSDHAIVRYLERCKRIDMEAIRQEIRTLAEEATPAKDGEHHWHPSGVVLVLGQDGQVVTVLGQDQLKKWLGRKLADGTRAAVSETTDRVKPTMTAEETVEFLRASGEAH